MLKTLQKQVIDKHDFLVFLRDLSSNLNINLKHMIEDSVKGEGIKGDKGQRGDTGIGGRPGDKREQGFPGPTGKTGATGASFEVNEYGTDTENPRSISDNEPAGFSWLHTEDGELFFRIGPTGQGATSLGS